MSKIFITGSSDGLGLLAATKLIEDGHIVVLHARNMQRAGQVLKKIPNATEILTGDLSNIEEVKILAEKANAFGKFDALIHNAGVYTAPKKDILNVNVLAPYTLNSLMEKPARLVYLSSGMHLSGDVNFENLRKANITYSDSKLYVVMLANAVAREWESVFSNSVNPGWVPTKMGGKGAPDDLQKGWETQVWLATSNDAGAQVSGKYFFHQKPEKYHSDAGNTELQNEFLKTCAEITGIEFPR